ncbi:MAG TPA: HAD family hydrolase [Solirubrobacteraceae bacterium]|nr:HAD family hydrolase [Solirubrobacteraceae bacterium]
MPRSAALLDVDGTLVDSVYQHTLAWHRAFRDEGLEVEVWRVHRRIGMGGDQIVSSLCGDEVEERQGEALRDAEKRRFEALIDEVRPLPGARALVEALKERGHEIVLASSAKEEELEHYIDLLEVRELADAWTSSADVEATKPAPDLVEIARGTASVERAVMVGDSTWDAEAAGRAGVPTIGLLTGGFSEAELRDAGADPVFASLDELRDGLEGTPLR